MRDKEREREKSIFFLNKNLKKTDILLLKIFSRWYTVLWDIYIF